MRKACKVPDIVSMELEQQCAGALYPLFGAVQCFCSAFGLTVTLRRSHASCAGLSMYNKGSAEAWISDTDLSMSEDHS